MLGRRFSQKHFLFCLCFFSFFFSFIEAAKRPPTATRNPNSISSGTGRDVKSQLSTGTGSSSPPKKSVTSKGSSSLLDTLQSENAIENAKVKEDSSTVSKKKNSVDQGKKVVANNNRNSTHVNKSKPMTKVKVQEAPAVTSENDPGSLKTVPSSSHLKSDGKLSEKGPDDFKVKFLSSTQAYLQSPRWGNGDNYPPALDVWERLEIPKGKALCIAVQHLNLLDHSPTTTTSNSNSNNLKVCDSVTVDTLSMFTVNKSDTRTLLWTVCGSQRPLSVVVLTAARAVDFHFTTKNKTYNSGAYAVGFKLWLTFFEAKNETSGKGRPETRLPSNWPWPDFNKSKSARDHLCKGEGVVWIGGMCLKILRLDAKPVKKSWTMVEELCLKENATLPSLHMPREWQALMDFVNGNEFQKEGSPSKLYVGLRFGNFSPPGYEGIPLYGGLGQWTDGSVAFFLRDLVRHTGKQCTAFTKSHPRKLVTIDCNKPHNVHVICQLRHDDVTAGMAAATPTVTPQIGTLSSNQAPDKKSSQPGVKFPRLVKCPRTGHFVQAYLACDVDCYGNSTAQTTKEADGPNDILLPDPLPSKPQCPVPLTPPPPSFTCDSGTGRVPYAWVCDGRVDCWDESDEMFCHYLDCDRGRGARQSAQCSGGWQCIDSHKQCDGHSDCSDGSDESPTLCNTLDDSSLTLPAVLNTLPPPVVLDTNRHGYLTLKSLNESHAQENIHSLNGILAGDDFVFTCPAETHFKCSLFCMPVYLRCNGVKDCPQGEDEASCESYQCPGYYRCRGSLARAGKVCVHVNNVCDGVYHCPFQDDETQCDVSCPTSCSCQYAHAFTCRNTFVAKLYPSLRYLHAKESGMLLGDLSENKALVYLNLASCEISSLDDLTAVLDNLRTLDLSFNKIRNFGGDVFAKLPSLRDLSLRSNPLVFPFSVDGKMSLPGLQRLDLAMVWIFEVDGQDLSKLDLHDLRVLNLSYTGLERVIGGGFQSLDGLQVLDVRGCPLNDFTEDSFTQLLQLQELHGSNPRLCCPGNFPDSEDFVCSVPEDLKSSCDSLLFSNSYRLLLIIFASLALGGNVVSFVYRLFINKDETGHSCGVMVTHLSVSDFLMGVYLVIIGVTDTRYGSTYFVYSEKWKSSATCKVAGFLSLLSCEASAFFICLLTIDRLAALRFPNSRLHFRKSSAQLTCWMTWFAALFIGAVPLIESHWKFYGETGTCLPLPTSAKSFDGRDYSFGVLIMLNFTLFFMIAVGQALIFWAMKSKQKTLGVNSEYQSLERAITKRLIAIAVTDFLCWFPVCLVGFMASNGAAMPAHINTALSIVVLPLNSAINPFIYTLVMIKEQRNHRLRGFLESETTFMI